MVFKFSFLKMLCARISIEALHQFGKGDFFKKKAQKTEILKRAFFLSQRSKERGVTSWHGQKTLVS